MRVIPYIPFCKLLNIFTSWCLFIAAWVTPIGHCEAPSVLSSYRSILCECRRHKHVYQPNGECHVVRGAASNQAGWSINPPKTAQKSFGPSRNGKFQQNNVNGALTLSLIFSPSFFSPQHSFAHGSLLPNVISLQFIIIIIWMLFLFFSFIRSRWVIVDYVISPPCLITEPLPVTTTGEPSDVSTNIQMAYFMWFSFFSFGFFFGTIPSLDALQLELAGLF